MRPVNLIPPDQRRGGHARMRTGPLPYLLLGGLVALLIGVAMLVNTNNQISDRKAEVSRLEREDEAARVKAERLAAYVSFQTAHEQRLTTIASLADSRFDWERVMRELALIVPGDVWLETLSASASASAGVEGGGGSLRGSVAGPALEINGCANGQEAVAGFVTALEDIDGVTRVGVEESKLPELTGDSVATGGGESSGCQTRNFIAEFKMTVAFDAAPVPAATGAEGEVPATVTEGAETTAAAGESEAGASEGETESTGE